METWPGGRVRTTKAGKKSYYIYKRINGRLYEVSTRTSTLRAAMVELARFEADPEGYKPGGTPRKEEVRLTPELAEEFLEWSLKVKGNTPRHVYYQRDFLTWWEGHLRKRDLRNLDLRYLEEPLEETPSRKSKIITIKAFYGWLVGVKRLLEPTEDPTYRRMKVPKPRAAQLQKKKALTADEFQAIRAKLEAYSETRNRAGGSPFPSRWLDALDVLAGTGWHVTELERFSTEGEIEEVKHSDGAGILQVIHKSGAVHRTLVSERVLVAARRIRERKKPFSGDSLRTALQRACDALKIPRLHPGSLRHSIATHAINSGAAIERTSEFLGHKSKETTETFYATFATPSKVPTFL